MGKVIRSLVRGIGGIFGGGHERHEAPQAAPQAPAQNNQFAEYQAALQRQQNEIAAEHGKRKSEMEAVTKRTQEGMMRANRARRQGGIFTEAQSTNVQPSVGSLG